MKAIYKLFRGLLVVGIIVIGVGVAVPLVRQTGFLNPNHYEPKNVPGDINRFVFNGQNRIWYSYSPNLGEGPRPVVLLLHGSGRTGAAMIDMWQEAARQFELILVAPDAANTQGWNLNVDGPDFLMMVLDQAEQISNLDTDNIFIFGHSSGAMHAQMLADSTDGPWRAVVAHAGYVAPDRLSQNPGDVPMLFLLGVHDHLFSVEGLETSAAAFQSMGHPTESRIIGDHTHWYYSDAPGINILAWEFMSRYINSDVVDDD